jgi:hypothetical protein
MLKVCRRHRGRCSNGAPALPGRVAFLPVEFIPIDGQSDCELVSGAPNSVASFGQVPPPRGLTFLTGSKAFDILAGLVDSAFEAG